MTQEEIVKSLESVHAKYRNHFGGDEELVSIGNLCHESADLIESLTARVEKAEAERDAAVEDIEKLLEQPDYLGVCWACANDCKKGDECKPKWRGAIMDGEKESEGK